MDAPPVQYVKTSDGYNIAYAVSGQGRPFVLLPQVGNHIQLLWSADSHVRPWLEALAGRFRLVQYDGRGQGMSQRGLEDGYDVYALLRDLDAVIDGLRLSDFVLMGSHIGGHTAVRFAVQHPALVHALVLACCTPSGSNWPLITAIDLARQRWETFSAAYLSNTSLPRDQRLRGVQIFRESFTEDDWSIVAPHWVSSQIGSELAKLMTPTLIIHPRGFTNISIQESSRVAAAVRGAQLVVTEGDTIYGDSGSGVKAIEDFLSRRGADGHESVTRTVDNESGLSPRELEVLRLVGRGLSNQQIADELVISQNTVIRHVSNIFAKIGAANRAEAASYATRHGIA